MKTCPSCGGQVRDDAVFCPACGTSFDPKKRASTSEAEAPITTVPLITLAPQENTFSKQRLIRYGKLIMGMLLVIVLALAAAGGAAYFQNNSYKNSAIESVEDDSYRKCLSLVNDVRNDNFDALIDDLVSMSGEAENYNFLSEYEKLFKKIVPDTPEDENVDPEQYKTAVKFRNCCFMVSYTEFEAKRYEHLADKALIGALYRKQADAYRTYADELYKMLENANGDEELQTIIDYCEDRDIIKLKDAA